MIPRPSDLDAAQVKLRAALESLDAALLAYTSRGMARRDYPTRENSTEPGADVPIPTGAASTGSQAPPSTRWQRALGGAYRAFTRWSGGR